MSNQALDVALKLGEIACIRLRRALDKSVELQHHYAKLLNMYDGGDRLLFTDTDKWLSHIDKLESDRLECEEYARAHPPTADNLPEISAAPADLSSD